MSDETPQWHQESEQAEQDYRAAVEALEEAQQSVARAMAARIVAIARGIASRTRGPDGP